MERKIELLLHVVADMRRFEAESSDVYEINNSDELCASELDLVCAARSHEILNTQNDTKKPLE